MQSEGIDYEKEMERLEEQWRKADQLTRSTERGYNKLFSEMFYERFKKSEDVPFRILDEAPGGIVMELPTVKNGVIQTLKEKQRDNPYHIKYFTDWSGGATLPNHFHSDCSERMAAISGSFLVIIEHDDGSHDKFILNAGEDMDVAAGVRHQVSALERGNMAIDFYKETGDHITPSYT